MFRRNVWEIQAKSGKVETCSSGFLIIDIKLINIHDIEVSISAWVSHAMPLKSIYHFPPTWDFQCLLSFLLEGGRGFWQEWSPISIFENRWTFWTVPKVVPQGYFWSQSWDCQTDGREMSAQIIQMMAFILIMAILKTSEWNLHSR